MRVVVAVVLLLSGCTSDSTVETAPSTPADTGSAASAPAPASEPDAPASEPADATAGADPSTTESSDLSGLDQVVEDLGVPPQTVLGVSITACASLAEGSDRAEVEQQLRDMEAQLSLEGLDDEQLAAVVDAGIEALCPDRGEG